MQQHEVHAALREHLRKERAGRLLPDPVHRVFLQFDGFEVTEANFGKRWQRERTEMMLFEPLIESACGAMNARYKMTVHMGVGRKAEVVGVHVENKRLVSDIEISHRLIKSSNHDNVGERKAPLRIYVRTNLRKKLVQQDISLVNASVGFLKRRVRTWKLHAAAKLAEVDYCALI